MTGNAAGIFPWLFMRLHRNRIKTAHRRSLTAIHQMMIQVNIEENEDGKYKLTWQLEVDENLNNPQESLHSTYDEAGQKALQLIAAANPNQTNLTNFGGI